MQISQCSDLQYYNCEEGEGEVELEMSINKVTQDFGIARSSVQFNVKMNLSMAPYCTKKSAFHRVAMGGTSEKMTGLSSRHAHSRSPSSTRNTFKWKKRKATKIVDRSAEEADSKI